MGDKDLRMPLGEGLSRRDFELGLGSCLTVGLALLCDEVYEDGAAAMSKLGELTTTLGSAEAMNLLYRFPNTLGQLRSDPRCSALPQMGVKELRQMVFQMQMFREMHGRVLRSLT